MTTYDGPATVIADGTEHEVTAQLTSTSREWYGSLTVADGTAASAIFGADDTRLRIGSRDADFLANDGNTDMDIKGSGRPPFGG